MNSIRILSIVILICASVVAQPADLGTFGSHNDLQNGVASYTMPPDNRIPNDIFVLAFINYTYVNSEGKEVIFSEEKAKYGEGRIKNVIGKVVHITNYEDLTDHTACSHRIRGTNGNELPPQGTSWIALIRRGNCPFDDKVRHVYDYRAAGVIVYNDRNETILNKMKIIDQTRDIAAVLTFKYIGEDMAKIVDSGQELFASISEGRYARPLPNMNKTSVLFVSISFIVLMIISFVWLVFYYVQRFRYLQTKDRKSRQLCTVAKRVISKIPTKSIKSEDSNDIDSDCCAICIEPYKITDIIRVLPCRHEFHKSCIDPWLLEHRTCPMCKMDILKHYGFVFTGSQESILQLDMDTEDGGDTQRANNSRATNNASPTYVIQMHQDIRRHSIDSIAVARMQSTQDRRRSNDVAINIEPNSKCVGYLAPGSFMRSALSAEDASRDIRASISLPCTLRRYKNSQSLCHGGNCQAWAFNFQHLNLKTEKPEALGTTSSPTNADTTDIEATITYDDKNGTNSDSEYIRAPAKDDGDNEYLLPNEHDVGTDGDASADIYECGVRSRRNSRVSEQQNSNADRTRGNI